MRRTNKSDPSAPLDDLLRMKEFFIEFKKGKASIRGNVLSKHGFSESDPYFFHSMLVDFQHAVIFFAI